MGETRFKACSIRWWSIPARAFETTLWDGNTEDTSDSAEKGSNVRAERCVCVLDGFAAEFDLLKNGVMLKVRMGSLIRKDQGA